MYKKILKLAIIFVLIFNWIFGYPPIYENFWQSQILDFPPEIKETQAATRTIEQQINIIDQEYSTGSTSYVPTDNSLGIIKFDPDKYNAETLYFEAVLKTESGGSYTRYRSSSFSVPASAKEYTVRLSGPTDSGCTGGEYESKAQLYNITNNIEVTTVEDNFCTSTGGPNGDSVNIKAARLIIVQTDGTSITATETQIEVGNNENTTSESYADLTDKKIYLYDHNQFDPAPSAYFEATLKSTSSYSEATYYFSGYDTGEAWFIDPNKMVDGNTGTWAKAGNSNETQLNNSNTCDATCAARSETITKVELRIHACAETGDNPDITLRPVFPGPLDGNDHTYTPNAVCASNNGSNAYWSSDFDITTDDNAPSPWTWGAIQTLDCDVSFVRVGGPDYGYATRVEIIVTYESGTGTAYAQLYNKTNGTVVANSQVSVNSTSWTLIRGSNALSTNWDTVSDDEYFVQVKTSSGATAYIANAKIILTQSDAGGIDKFETVQQYINTKDISGSESYVLEDFDNEYNPANWVGGTFNYYFEAVLRKINASTVYAQLYNVSDSEAIDNTTNSEVSTTNSLYTREKSADLFGNTDWPTGVDNDVLDTQIKHAGEVTPPFMEISNSWLIIQVSDLTLTLATTIQIRNVADNADVSSITFPAGDISAVISNPTGNSDVQVLTATGSEAAPVAILKSSTAYTLWYNVTAGSGWTATVASEKLYAQDLNAELNLTNFGTSAKEITVWGTDQTATPQAVDGTNNEELFLQITLTSNAGKSGTSTLTILGETP